MTMLNKLLALATSVFIILTTESSVYALPIPTYTHIGAIPSDGTPGPDEEMEQKDKCKKLGTIKNSDFRTVPATSIVPLARLHAIGTGKGQLIAILDSGVTPNVRLPHLRGGGDYVMGADGLFDCDGHGTLVAGIIGASPSQHDGFSGVAPDAGLIAVRVISGAFGAVHPPIAHARPHASSIHALAQAIVHVTNMHATVINISMTACADSTSPPDLSELTAAIYDAAVTHNIVIISSAGNTDDSSCAANPAFDPGNPSDKRNWSGATTYSIPSYFFPLVLSVGGVTPTGDPYALTTSGPWVGVSAPAQNIISLDPTGQGKLTNAEYSQREKRFIILHGTSYAAPYVAGVAALIREKYPHLTAAQVIRRIEKTAHTPAVGMENTLGAGIIDPEKALTASVDVGTKVADGVPDYSLPVVTKHVENHQRELSIAAVFVGMLVIAVILIVALSGKNRENT